MNWNTDIVYIHTMVALMWLANWKSRSRLRMEPILWWDLVPTDPDGVSSGDEDPVSSSVNDNCFEMKLFAAAGRNCSGLGVCRVGFGTGRAAPRRAAVGRRVPGQSSCRVGHGRLVSDPDRIAARGRRGARFAFLLFRLLLRFWTVETSIVVWIKAATVINKQWRLKQKATKQ